MTVSTEPVPVSYNGDDATVDFSIPWKYFSKSDVRVTHRSAAGVETTWVLSTDFTLTAAGDDAGGTLTATTAPASGAKITIDLDTPNTQTASFPKGGDFPSTTAEDALDRLTQIAAKIEQLFNRALRVPITDTQTGSLLELPIDSSRASQFLAFDADGMPIVAAGTSADLGPVSAFVNTLLDDATGPDFMETLHGSLAAETAPAVDDELFLYDLSVTTVDKITLANLLKVVNALTEDASPQSVDFLMTYDASASAVKKLALSYFQKNPAFISNFSFAASVASKAMTVALKGADGNDPSATNIVTAAFRSTTATASTHNIREITAANSIVVPSGATLGFSAGAAGFVYVYLCDDGSSREIGVAKKALFDESTLHSTTAVSTSADSDEVLYTTSALTGAAVRLIGRITVTTGGVAGEWDNAPTHLESWTPSMKKTGDVIQTVYNSTGALIDQVATTGYDDTTPQSSEGVAVTSKAITPKNILNRYEIDGQAFLSTSTAADVVILALHDDITGANALAATAAHTTAANETETLHVYHEMAVGNIGTRTFAIRAGRAGANNLNVNGGGGTRKFNGTANSYIRVKEIQA